jgi:hypothetical protein
VIDIHVDDHRTSHGAPEPVRAGCSGYAATMQTPGLIVIGSRPTGVGAKKAELLGRL